MNWIISANSRMYDHSSSFEHYGAIDWRQGKTKFKAGDIVYIYCTRPIMMLQYKCVIDKVDLSFSEIRDDKEYWINKEEYTRSLAGKFMKLRLIEQISNNHMKLENLMKNGLRSAPQGPIKIKSQKLQTYLDKYFMDNHQSDFFPEVIKTSEYEGAKKAIVVNKYERSSKAREQAVKYHGINCKICNLNFEEMYGVVGEGFIHIHHRVPMYKIGKNYKIDYKKDLIPVCPNCHSMLHRKLNGKEVTVKQLREIIERNKR